MKTIILQQVEPPTRFKFGFQCDECGKKFTALHRMRKDAELAALMHQNACRGEK